MFSGTVVSVSLRGLCVVCRAILDRGYSDWDDYLTQLDLTSTAPVKSRLQQLITHIKENRM